MVASREMLWQVTVAGRRRGALRGCAGSAAKGFSLGCVGCGPLARSSPRHGTPRTFRSAERVH